MTKESNEYIILKVIFIGGFLFHIAWEAKGQYTLPYFMLMVPVSLSGYCSLIMYNQGYISFGSVKNLNGVLVKLKVCGFGLAIALIAFIDNQFINETIKLNFDTETYEQYIYNNTSDKIREGYYNLKTYKEPQLTLTFRASENNTDEAIVFLDNFKEEMQGNVRLQDIGERMRIQFTHSNYCLDLDMNDEQKGFVHAYTRNTNEAQQWYLKKAEGERQVYYIIKGSSALTYNEEDGTVRLDERDYNDLQKWIIE